MVHALVIAIVQKGVTVVQVLLGKSMFVERMVDGHESRLLSFGAPWTMDLLAIVYLLVVVAISALTYRFVEMPGQSTFNAFLLRTREPAAIKQQVAKSA